MPRQPRIDYPGYLYHVMARGIERRKIFVEEADYVDFMERLEKCLRKTGSRCFAFTLLPNHFHLLILRGQNSLAEFMRRLMTGYAVNFNRRHMRVGHLFQNRYKAILCDLDSYLLELVAYIHLNPLRAGIVNGLAELRKYRWCGHGIVMGRGGMGFLAVEDILVQFGKNVGAARREYESFVRARVGRYRGGELSSGGLRRSAGFSRSLSSGREEEMQVYDERVLGDGDFVESVVRRKEEWVPEKKVLLEEIIGVIKKKTGVGEREIRSRSQVRGVVKARALYCYLARERSGISGAELMKQLKMTSGAISSLITRGRGYFDSEPLSL
jgi:putative transposase